MTAAKIRERTLLILDISDITKALRREDAVPGTDARRQHGGVADGYWLCQVVAVANEDNAIIPLYSTLYSQRAPDFVSENAELKAAIVVRSMPT